MIQTINPQSFAARIAELRKRGIRYGGPRLRNYPGRQYAVGGQRECERRKRQDAQQVQLLSHYPNMTQTYHGIRTTFPRHIAGLPARGALTTEQIDAAAKAML